MLKVLILICPMHLDPSACDESNALDVMRSERVSNAAQCGLSGQTFSASTGALSDLSKGYMKIMCRHVPETASR